MCLAYRGVSLTKEASKKSEKGEERERGRTADGDMAPPHYEKRRDLEKEGD